MTDVWSPQQLDVLHEGIQAGHSASQIATLVDKTRNAVLGKINRLKAKARRQGLEIQGLKAKPGGPKRRGARPNRRQVEPQMRSRVALPPTETAEPECYGFQPLRLNIMALEDHHCRWPYGSKPYTFCGHTKCNGGSYCAFHRAVSVSEAAPRYPILRPPQAQPEDHADEAPSPGDQTSA